MVVHVTLMAFLLTGHVRVYYCFILGLEVMAILDLMVLMPFMQSIGRRLFMKESTLQLFITKKANDQQRKALVNIMSGQAKGEGPFALFATTMKYILDPQFVDIIVAVNGKEEN
jgi:hypothetical protein